MCNDQSHLGYADTINLGSYYTPEHLVDIAYKMLRENIPNLMDFIILDTSCGYGNFLRFPNSIGADYDVMALEEARKNTHHCKLINHNSLHKVNRSQYGLSDVDKFIIVGNPPYNDTTSIIRNEIKKEICEIDPDLKHRDMGISFLLSYNKLAADYICVLHPLSYLIKKANFESLGKFKDNYILIDNVIISSGEFSATSKATQFPIIIALYKRDSKGMSYSFIEGHSFKTKDGKTFRINQFDKLSNYITKYPNQKAVSMDKTVAFFWTMRDINALKRTRTFIERETYNSIRVPREKLALYCYADVFKEYIPHIPYYFGNNDIMIDLPAFERIQDAFVRKSLSKYKFLRNIVSDIDYDDSSDRLIGSYFNSLLGEHYVHKNN